MSMPGDQAAQEESADIDEVLTVLAGSATLDLLGITDEDLQVARHDSELLETLRITHGLLLALRDNGVLGTFVSLPKDDQANFIRWVGAIDSEDMREARTGTFIAALQQSALADRAR